MKLELIPNEPLMFKILQWSLIEKDYFTQRLLEGFIPLKVDQGPYDLTLFSKVLVNDV
jgi:hypothetical protein